MKSPAVVALSILAFCAVQVAHADAPALRGYVAAAVPAEQKLERQIDAAPNAEQAMRDEIGMASYVHRMGQAGDLRSATYFRDQLVAAGWDAKLVEYVVPIVYPTEQKLTLVTGTSQKAIDLYEPSVPGDPYSYNHRGIGIPYSGYSNDGDVTGPIVYVNQGTADDYAALAKLNVNVNGAIAVARPGGGALTAKAFEGAKHGVRAVLVFSDPLHGGYFDGDTYPNGPYRPTGGAMRNTMLLTNDPGDPTAMGIPVPGASHKPFSTIHLPSIPEMPITGNVARTLLATLAGPSAPNAWHPGFAMPIHLGGTSAARAHFIIKSKRFFGPIWDVVATMKGQDPSQMIVVGGHRDAWTYGSVDPISGSVDMLQLSRALGRAHAGGWTPQRSITIGSWDGEELNLFGSETWVDQHAAELRAGLVAYVNTDEVAFGPRFGAYATPELRGVIASVAQVAHAPNGQLLATYWAAQDPKMEISPVGGGSDHEPFVYHENLPAVGAGYGGPFGTYHSAYDDIASLRILDPGMKESVAATRFTGLLIARLADATYPDIRLSAVAGDLRDRLAAFAAEKTNPDKRAAVVAKLQPDVDAFAAAAATLDSAADAAVAGGDVTGASHIYASLRASEAAFYDATTTQWQRSLLYDLKSPTYSVLPTLDATLDATTGDAALAQLDAVFQAATAATKT